MEIADGTKARELPPHSLLCLCHIFNIYYVKPAGGEKGVGGYLPHCDFIPPPTSEVAVYMRVVVCDDSATKSNLLTWMYKLHPYAVIQCKFVEEKFL